MPYAQLTKSLAEVQSCYGDANVQHIFFPTLYLKTKNKKKPLTTVCKKLEEHCVHLLLIWFIRLTYA